MSHMRRGKVISLGLAIAMGVGAGPMAVLAQQSPPVAAVPPPTIPLAIRAMTPDEKTEYDGWIAAAQAATNARHWAEAEGILRKVLALEEATLGPACAAAATTMSSIGRLLIEQAKYSEAERMFRAALGIYEKVLDLDHPVVAAVLTNLAHCVDALGQANEAEKLLRRALAIREKLYGSAPDATASILDRLANFLNSHDRPREAEPLYRRALAIRRQILGPEHPDTIDSINHLAEYLNARRDLKPAEQLLRDVVAIQDKIKGSEDAEVARGIINLATNLNLQNRFAEAEPFWRKAAAIYEKVYGPTHPSTVTSLGALAGNLGAQGRASEADSLFQRVLEAYDKEPNLDRPGTTRNLIQLSLTLVAQGRTNDAELLLRRAVDIRQAMLGPAHPDTAVLAENLALIQLAKSPAFALVSARQALAVRRVVAIHEGTGSDEDAQTRLSRATGMAGLLFARSALTTMKTGGGDDSLVAESFAAVQSISATSAGRALARGTARASLDRRGQELAQKWEAAVAARAGLDRRFTEAAALSGQEGDTQRVRLSKERVIIDSDVKQLQDSLRAAYPEYFNLIAPGPVSLAELQKSVAGRQALLRTDEALILLTPGSAWLPRDQRRGMVFAVTREGVAWTEIGIDPQDLTVDICRIRILLDPENRYSCNSVIRATTVAATPASDSSTLPSASPAITTRTPASGRPSTGAQRGYDRATARRLYDALFGAPEIAKLIAGKREWIISPQAALLSLPFAALVAGDYSGDDADVAALRATPWLGMTRALSVIPEVSSLKALRGLSRRDRATQRPFFGMGDPDFASGADGATQTAIATPVGKGRRRGGADSDFPDPVQSYVRDASIDVSVLSKLAPLPGTRIEIETLAKSFKASSDSFLLGKDATEENLRKRSGDGSLTRARVVAFATHGLIAGDLGGRLAEPALAFTPPVRRRALPKLVVTAANDGLLTASEAATLKLAADWVILSACNTASGGDNSAEGLTGLARAFFYAGADTLLVSHWRVRDDAAARLTTRAVEIAQTPGSQKTSRASALQQSMRELMNDTTNDGIGASFAHPSAWAPFTIIGVER